MLHWIVRCRWRHAANEDANNGVERRVQKPDPVNNMVYSTLSLIAMLWRSSVVTCNSYMQSIGIVFDFRLLRNDSDVHT